MLGPEDEGDIHAFFSRGFCALSVLCSSRVLLSRLGRWPESVHVSITSRIIGGKDADIRIYPYQALIRFKGKYLCSASSISEYDVLTAAHCFTHHPQLFWPYLDITVHTGTSSSQEIGKMHRVMKVTIHEKWTGTIRTAYIHDIAHIKLKDKIEFDKYQQKVNLPTRNVDSGMTGLVTGWGKTDLNKERLSERLQSLQMQILNYSDCQTLLPKNVILHEEHLCAFQQKGRGCSKGDSGAPLVIGNTVVGIHSWNIKGFCAAGKPEFFTNVFAEREFINTAINACY